MHGVPSLITHHKQLCRTLRNVRQYLLEQKHWMMQTTISATRAIFRMRITCYSASEVDLLSLFLWSTCIWLKKHNWHTMIVWLLNSNIIKDIGHICYCESLTPTRNLHQQFFERWPWCTNQPWGLERRIVRAQTGRSFCRWCLYTSTPCTASHRWQRRPLSAALTSHGDWLSPSSTRRWTFSERSRTHLMLSWSHKK